MAGTGKVEATQMIDSAPLLQAGQMAAAKERLARDGYLLLQNYLPAERLSEVVPPHAAPDSTFFQHAKNAPLCRHMCFCWMSYTVGNLAAAHLRYVAKQSAKWRQIACYLPPVHLQV